MSAYRTPGKVDPDAEPMAQAAPDSERRVDLHSDFADALLLLLEIAGWFGPPFVSAIARTVRTEYPHLIATLERALSDDAPVIGPTPPTRESGKLEVLRRRAERLRRRFGR